MHRTESVYVVQRLLSEDERVDGEPYRRWEDFATVTVPAQTKRRTVIEKAAAELSLDGSTLLRVIPAEHAEPIKVEMEQPPPRLRIG